MMRKQLKRFKLDRIWAVIVLLLLEVSLVSSHRICKSLVCYVNSVVRISWRQSSGNFIAKECMMMWRN